MAYPRPSWTAPVVRRLPRLPRPGSVLPDTWFDVTDVAADWVAKLDATSRHLGDSRRRARVLTIIARSPRPT